MNEDFPAVSKTLASTLPVLNIVRLGLAAFATGARTIPLGDNGILLRDLAGRGGSAAGTDAHGHRCGS